MPGSVNSKNPVSLETSIPDGGVSLESILCTEELRRRPSRSPDYEKENRALVALVTALADSPATVLQTLAETILGITESDSAGISLLTRDDGGKRFYWPAIAGVWNPYVGGGTPRDFGPCGDVLNRNCTLLFSHFERRYPYLMPVLPPAEECLLLPFRVGGTAVGTIWAIMHSDRHKFDAEDERVMGALGQFASSAYRAVVSIDDLKFQVAEREQAETELRKLTDGLETIVRVRTEELEQRNRQLGEARARLADEKLALERSEAYLAEAQRLTHTGAWAFDPSAPERSYWSLEYYRIYGFDPAKDQPSRSAVLERIHPDDRSYLDRVFNEAIQNSTDFEEDHRIVLPDGTTKHLHVVVHPVVNEAGEVVEFVGTSMDVTEQHRNRAALEQAFEEIRILKDQLYKENLALRDEVDRASMFEEIVGTSTALQRVLSRIAKVAPTDSTVFITGETGTGKELIARAVHKRSLRSERAFVSVNCSAMAPSLIQSELFGHEKGAFTGATQRRLGRFELADGGTIFLDEVGELPPDMQIALLRVLQEREIERVGGTRPIKVDVRIIAATNRDLEAATDRGAFRPDLFYRLNVFPIEIPPLRERKDDILMLLEYFVKRYSNRAGKNLRSIDKNTLELFQAYEWPGNIRELQNVIERSVIVSSSDVFSVDESWLSKESSRIGSAVRTSPPVESNERSEKEMIEAALAETRGRVSGPSGAAAKLGLPPSTLESRIKALKISKGHFKFGRPRNA
jgi:PAS domain S-box-containing protein